jgi:hypothetical protein
VCVSSDWLDSTDDSDDDILLKAPAGSGRRDSLRSSGSLRSPCGAYFAGATPSPRPLSVPPGVAFEGRFTPCYLGVYAPLTRRSRAGMEGAGRSTMAADVSTAANVVSEEHSEAPESSGQGLPTVHLGHRQKT